MRIQAHVDSRTPFLIGGWAVDHDDPADAVSLTAKVGGEIVGSCIANRFRRDLLDAQIGTGHHAFLLKFDRMLTPDEHAQLVVLALTKAQAVCEVSLPPLLRPMPVVRAPERLSPRDAVDECKTAAHARNLFERMGWVKQFLKSRKLYDQEFFVKQMIVARHIERDFVRKEAQDYSDCLPYTVLQYWDSVDVPEDVMSNILYNSELFRSGRSYLFDDSSARNFINVIYGNRALSAYDYCHHPAMKSDYFRLCYLYACGGVYIDADNVLCGPIEQIEPRDNCLFISPLIREKEAVNGAWRWFSLDEFLEKAKREDMSAVQGWMAVFNNDVMATCPLNEVIGIALARATFLIEECKNAGIIGNIHGVTGPTNLTEAVLIDLIDSAVVGRAPSNVHIFDRERFIKIKPLAYKGDERYWVNVEMVKPGVVPVLA